MALKAEDKSALEDTPPRGYPAVSDSIGSLRTPTGRYPPRGIIRPVGISHTIDMSRPRAAGIPIVGYQGGGYTSVSISIGPFRNPPGGNPGRRILSPVGLPNTTDMIDPLSRTQTPTLTPEKPTGSSQANLSSQSGLLSHTRHTTHPA